MKTIEIAGTMFRRLKNSATSDDSPLNLSIKEENVEADIGAVDHSNNGATKNQAETRINPPLVTLEWIKMLSEEFSEQKWVSETPIGRLEKMAEESACSTYTENL